MNSPMKILLAAGLLVVSCGTASAQQPGSTGYNTVFLPAHGVGDTRQAAEQWGAFASGKRGVIGWAVDGGSEAEASQLAMDGCRSQAGEECRVEFTFVNECAVLTRNASRWFWRTGNQGLRRLTNMTVRQCGEDCSVIRTGCALP